MIRDGWLISTRYKCLVSLEVVSIFVYVKKLHLMKLKNIKGQFGVVKLGKIGNELVAVKIMKQGSMEESSFIDEAEVMAYV